MLLFLGNHSAVEPQPGTSSAVNDEDSAPVEPVKIPGDQVTTVEVPAGTPIDAALTEVKNLWKLHSEGDPQWVDGNDDLLVRAVASTFGCPIGRPDEVEDTDTDES